MSNHYEHKPNSVSPKPAKEVPDKPKKSADVLLQRAIRKCLRDLGPQVTAKTLVAEMWKAGFPREIRRHL